MDTSSLATTSSARPNLKREVPLSEKVINILDSDSDFEPLSKQMKPANHTSTKERVLCLKDTKQKKMKAKLQPVPLIKEVTAIVLDPLKKIIIFKELARHLMPHQIDVIKQIYKSCYATVDPSGCIIAHPMGSGKTFVMTAFIHSVINAPTLHTSRILIVCPNQTAFSWTNEIQKWTKLMNNSRTLTLLQFSNLTEKSKQLYLLERFSKQSKTSSPAACFIIDYESLRSLVFFGGEKLKLSRKEMCY